MPRPPLYPLRFEPIFKSMPWGGRRLPGFVNRPAPHADPVGEAWVLSDVKDNPSVVADGPLAGTPLCDLLAPADAHRVLGRARPQLGRFPLLLKFIDARRELSVQVHPNDHQATLHCPGTAGKTEAWVVLDANPDTSRIYAGFRPGVTAADFRAALAAKTVPATLHSYTPEPGDCVFLEAGTVHAIGADLLIFEVQQTSDVTYRLYDWDRVDPKTGQPRELHVEKGLACANFAAGPCHAVRAKAGRLAACGYFTLDRHVSAGAAFRVGAAEQCRAVVCAAGRGELEWRGERYELRRGDVLLLPAAVGECVCHPDGEMTLLECGLPE
jgi:mannose-6-phosphate isomerase